MTAMLADIVTKSHRTGTDERDAKFGGARWWIAERSTVAAGQALIFSAGGLDDAAEEVAAIYGLLDEEKARVQPTDAHRALESVQTAASGLFGDAVGMSAAQAMSAARQAVASGNKLTFLKTLMQADPERQSWPSVMEGLRARRLARILHGAGLALIDGAGVTLADGDEGLLGFAPRLADAAMVLAELYRRDGRWKFRAVGQGFNGGLAPLARSFGIDVADEPAPPPEPVAPPRYERIALEAADEAVTLVPAEDGFGDVAVTLTWSQGRRRRDGSGGAVDLDLACLVELQDGRKGAVQAIGAMHGALHAPPFILLSGDDRTGGGTAGETLRISGDRWGEIRRVAVFANVYDGVPDWQHADPLLLVTAAAQPPIQLRVGAGSNDRRLCAIALLENDAGRLTVTRKVEYFIDQRQLDEHFDWGLQWQPGSKPG